MKPASSTRRRIVLPTLMALALGGCAAGPDFQRPAPPPSPGYTSGAQPSATVATATHLGASQRLVPGMAIEDPWWRALGSDRLDELIARGLRANPSLESARASLRQARETYQAQAGSSQFPQLDLSAGARRQALNPSAQGQPGDTRTFDLYETGIGLHYTLDLSGGIRRSMEALAARTDDQRHELAGAQLDLAASIASTAIARASLADRITVLEALIADQESRLTLTRRQYALGQLAPDAVQALEVQTAQARADLPDLRKRLDAHDHLLATLSGQAPGTAQVPDFRLEEFVLPTRLPLSLPSELAHGRPDILAAEALLHAANADYGVAVAKLYPQIDLGASLSTQALTTGALFGPGSAAWSLLGQLTQPLFRPGLGAEKRASLAALDAAAANYQGVVLDALRNVADSLRALDHDAQRLAAFNAADVAARGFLESAEKRQALGAGSQLDLLVAREQTRQTRLGLIDAQAQRLKDSVDLYHALGGGYRPQAG